MDQLLWWEQIVREHDERVRTFGRTVIWWSGQVRKLRDRRLAGSISRPQSAAATIIPITIKTTADGRHTPDMVAPAVECESLTPRQLEISSLVARGYTNRQIAEALTIEPGTAANHIEHILARLSFRNRTQIAAWYISRSEGQEPSFSDGQPRAS